MAGKTAGGGAWWRQALDGLVFSSLWVAGAAVTLAAAASRAMELAPAPAILGLALAGTLFVYTIDRLRDRERDRATAPERTAFVERWRRTLEAQVAFAGVAAVALAAVAGAGVVALAASVALLGLVHRRIKHLLFAKPVYLTLAWTAVAVGLPAAHRPEAAQHVGWVALVVAGTVASNVILSNLKDGEGAAARMGARRARTLAAANLVGVLVVAWAGPASVQPLAALPLAMLAAVAGYRPTERYGLLVVDGALLVGGFVAAAWVSAVAP